MQAALGLSERVRAAAAARRLLAPRGSGQWWPEPAAGAEVLDLRESRAVTRLDAADLVATAEAGCTLAGLGKALAAGGTWLALDPPGPATRTLGGVLASGGGGPLAALFGPPRDQVLGLELIAGNGTLVRTGGRVVKNVAGFDLAKAVIGSHGAFGLITRAHLRLRALPESDRSAAFRGGRAGVRSLAGAILADGGMPAALEALDPGLSSALGLDGRWVLVGRALGTIGGAEAELARASARAEPAGCEPMPAPADLWSRWREVVGAWPVILRVGADPAAWTDALDLLEQLAGRPMGSSATLPRGTVRAGFAALDAATVGRVRRAAAERGWPAALERGPAPLLAAAGVWGALSPGVERLTRSLRRAFDPDGVFAVPLLS